MLPKVYIILLNWNGVTYTLQCLESLKKVQYFSISVIVVDNNSSGNDVEIMIEHYGQFINKVIANTSNLGFAGGNNVGIKYAIDNSADYILLLNNDTIIEPNLVEVLLEKIVNQKKIGIVAPQINYFDEPNKIWTEGGKISKLRGAGCADSRRIEDGKSKVDREVSFVSGCCMLINKEVFQKVGLFDESFFLYVEDTDFCYRTFSSGYKIVVTNDTKIYHKVSSSTKKEYTALPLYYTTRNRLFFAKKNFPYFYFITFTYIFFVMLLKCIVFFLQGKRSNVKIILKAFKDFGTGKMGKANLKF